MILLKSLFGEVMSLSLPTFETTRLILRPVTEADAPSYEKHFADYAVIGNMTPIVPWPYPTGGVLDYFRTIVFPNQGINKWVWGICVKEQPDRVIGAIDVMRSGQPANRAFWLGEKFWGRGYMTEAVIPVMDYAFDQLGFENMILSNALGNQKSHRIKEKTGARLLRTEPARFINPDFTEREIWEITKSEWLMFRQSSVPHPPA